LYKHDMEVIDYIISIILIIHQETQSSTSVKDTVKHWN
jgi:hypothetical protein